MVKNSFHGQLIADRFQIRDLERDLLGRGRVVFVTGEAGQGKTALVQEFACRAQQIHPDLVIAGGHCNAHTGIGDPYLPFREILGLLTGDVEARWEAGVIQQSALFEQYSRVLLELASQRPLLLVLDDLQWLDGNSTSL